MLRFLRAIWRFLFPPSPWDACHVQTPAERLALRELRLGKHKAELALKAASITQACDQYTARVMRPAITPTLPGNHGDTTVRVVSIGKNGLSVSRAVRKHCQEKNLKRWQEDNCADRAMHAYRTGSSQKEAIRQGKEMANSLARTMARQDEYRPAQMSA